MNIRKGAFRLVIVLLSLGLGFASLSAKTSFSIQYRAVGFSDAQNTLIKEALGFVGRRFLNPAVASCAKRKTVESMFNSDYLERANFSHMEQYFKMYVGKAFRFTHFFDSQLNYFSNAPGGFPVINITATYEDSMMVGRAWTDDHVIVQSQIIPFMKSGRKGLLWDIPNESKREFNIFLNTKWLGDSSQSFGEDPEYWAGVISHEILHNLGHSHEKDKYEGLLITEFGNCVETNGQAIKASLVGRRQFTM